MKITLKDTYLCFENYESSSLKLSLDTPTAWKMKSGKGYYSLGSLWCVLTHKNLQVGEQMKKANEVGVKMIDYIDKKEVNEYFLG